MDTFGYFNKLNIDGEIINLIKDFCYIEEFALGDEIANSEKDLDKVSIVVSGGVRQININSEQKNIYKYIKNDILFIPQNLNFLKNESTYIASSDLKLLSIRSDKFINLINTNLNFKNWINKNIFSDEKVYFLQHLFGEKFNNTIDKELLLKNLKENITFIDEKIYQNIKEKKLKEKNFTIYSLSNNKNFKYLEKISFDDLLNYEISVLPRCFLLKNQFSLSKNLINKTAALNKISNSDKDYSEDASELPTFKDIQIKKTFNKKDNVIECFRVLCKLIDINYRFDPINNYLDSLDKINKKYAFINYAEIAYGLGLDVSYGQLNSDQVLSIKTPSLIVYKEELAIIVNSDGENITLIYPSEGLITLDKYELEDAYEDKINVINVSKNILTQGNKFSIS